MKFRREELVARAQVAVELILTTLAEKRLVPAFIENYAKTQKRSELLESATRYRELVLMLNREALLIMSSRLCTEVPSRLSGGLPEKETPAEAKSVETFREEYFLHLAKVMRWTPVDLEEFYNDFELMQMILLRQMARAKTAPAKKSKPVKPPVKDAAGPFADRAALLLDPSFLERARAAAAHFEPELLALADRALAAVLRPTTRVKPARLFT